MGKSIKRVIKYFVLIVLSFLMFYPLLWMFVNSFKTPEQILNSPINIFKGEFIWSNFSEALKLAPFDLYIFNSIVTAFIIVLIQLVLSCMLAYALTQFNFTGKKVLFGVLLLTYMLPSSATYVPSYILLSKMKLLDSLTGIVVSNIASVFTVFLLRQTFMQVPKDLLNAARVDGASDWTILWKIMVPISKSSMLTVGLISFVRMYNNYMWPALITKSNSNYLVSVGLNHFFTSQGNFGKNLARLMAANTLSVLPLLILFIVLQKWFIRGMSDSGIKG